MKKIGIGSITALVMVLASCSYLRVGDNAVRIRGELVQDETHRETCTLELRLSSTESPLRSLPVSGAFDRTFTVSPRPKTYYVTIYCPGVGQVFRSAPFHVKDTRFLSEPLNLGYIRMKANGTD